MKAIDRFRNFFRAEGVEMYERNSTSRDHLGDKVITVSQAHFYFKDGEYVGVKDDETGHFMPRIGAPKIMKRKIRKDLQVVEITSDEEGFTDEELTALEEESVTPLPEWFAEEPFLIVVEKKK